ncbi:MAG: hypothetical protein C75L2_00020094 [Leptospirillum sp. Group II 'C75']|jgi:hypothetical protein|uniref:hypothetical protein n=1 Tax=Leptospirillum sp. Group II 'CF-1' TaxID=1660083 RepID=UPI00029CCE29|nr:hypothetical protein [Leptospirillum sp. Group II 'CF-1']AKS22821.1 hypothetical protein ABH19_02240 [Leptospirillum sp. Group II 'CF-1']EIJ75196.1 MAG: hypothetical protein C75L2_00020094 [Leptospirillum sp. Group II 'C75']
MTVKDILADYLKFHGFDGLCHPNTECGCGLDDLIGPCEGAQQDCQPAHRIFDAEGYPWYTIAFAHRPAGEEAREKERTNR